ncbi:MAG: hypothetical protein WC615_06650 [Mucilaginibacter sp.]|jgi:hypothetical protein|uniref:hypothetical protein n=1 Tax=Mucilaginibacter sp. TaxID=1882438 RepID=UPI0035679B3D
MNPVKKNYIAYSLWGSNELYTIGMLKNIEQARGLYPGWQVIVYYDDTVPVKLLNEINAAGAVTINMTGGIYGMFWRFLAADLADCGRVIFRDSDSRLSERECLAVNEWIAGDRAIHIMRDHPYHLDPVGNIPHHILGGMWGIKGGIVSMREMIDNYDAKQALVYGSDQVFLNQIYRRFQNSATIHDEFFSGSPFPVKRKGYRFIGERVDVNEQPIGNDWRVIKAFDEKNKLSAILIRKVKHFLRSFLSKF